MLGILGGGAPFIPGNGGGKGMFRSLKFGGGIIPCPPGGIKGGGGMPAQFN